MSGCSLAALWMMAASISSHSRSSDSTIGMYSSEMLSSTAYSSHAEDRRSRWGTAPVA